MKDATRHQDRAGGARKERDSTDEGARLRAIVEGIADGIVIVDPDGLIRFANTAAERLFGRTAEMLLGSNLGFPVMAGESTEVEIVRPGADVVIAELRTVEIDWEARPALLISLRDVTDRHRAEEQARELAREQAARAAAQDAEERYRRLAQEKASLAEENAVLYQRSEAASRAKSEFLAIVSHELRTPLNAIMGYTDLLTSEISGPVTETQCRQLERIRASSRHLMEVVDDILTFSRMEAGREDLHLEAADYCRLAHEAASLVLPIADQKGVPVEVTAPEEPCSGETDPRKVRQILLNLLSNAVKFTDQGAVRLEAQPDGDEIVFHVHDSGIGIPASHLEAIWEPFWQVEDAHTRRAGGTGLGLSVVHRLCRMMGGDVGVRSTHGEGTTFTVRLPRVVRHRTSAADDNAAADNA
ncbi:MAG: sensor histidine kinase [Longimicrobiales bacterium]